MLRLASRYGVLPLVHSGLASLDAPVPALVRATLKAAYMGGVVRTRTWLEPTLHRTLGALESLGIEPIVLKGVALAYTAYADPAHRTLGDIDLLLPREHLDRAGDALVEAGFQAVASCTPPDHHLRVHHVGDEQVGVELHHSLLPEVAPYALDLGQLRTRARVERVAGVEIHVLAPHDALLHTCLHLAYNHRYRWYPLRSLTDILALTTRADRAVDWDLFLRTVQDSRTAGATYWPLALSRAWLGAPVPNPVLSSLAPPAATRRLVGAIAQPGYILDNQTPSQKGSDVLYGLLLELSLYTGCSAGQRLRAVVRSLFPPPSAVGHLPPDVTGSWLRYAANLGNPRRLARGLVAFCRLLARVPC